ncbi:MAG: hypothetical protein RL701_6809 [Pseudomonadota bacterium]|jgi:hypothetical protein
MNGRIEPALANKLFTLTFLYSVVFVAAVDLLVR